MIEIGKYNRLEITSKAVQGIYLTDGNENVLLPQRYTSSRMEMGDVLDVFVYLDNENRPVATTLNPFAQVNDFAFLKVKEVNKHGAFLDWGIAKDIFVPYSEQLDEMEVGQRYLVYILIDDKSKRITATEKFAEYIDRDTKDLSAGDEVELLIADKTDLGFKAIIDNRYAGLLYNNEIFDDVRVGEKRSGYVRLIREDGKVDLRLQKDGINLIGATKNILLDYLKKNDGHVKLGDKSSPEEIHRILKISKKAFKKAAGGLYKERLVKISDFEIELVKK